jgi:hypothetical protein
VVHDNLGPGQPYEAAGGDGEFRQLVLARIIEPASKIDSFEPTQAANVGDAYTTALARLTAAIRDE